MAVHLLFSLNAPNGALTGCQGGAKIALYYPPRWGVGGKQEYTMNVQTKEQVLSRLKSIEGHVRGIQRMVSDDNYCIDVISQVQAVQKALDRVNSMLLDNHLNSCVITAVRSDDSQERERVLGELLHVFETGSKL